MSSGGGKTTTNTTESGPPKWAIPQFQSMLSRANDVSQKGYQSYDGPRLAGFSDDQMAGFQNVRDTAAQGQPMMDAAQGYIGNQLSGQNAYQGGTNPYAGANNPYLGQMIGYAQDEVSRQFTDATQPNMLAQFQQGGAFGGSAMQQSMSGA